MSGNTESTSNSMKFAPMPMSALLANLMPFKNTVDSHDSSFSSVDDSDSSSSENVTRKPCPAMKTNKDFFTPTVKPKPKDIKAFVSEKKIAYNEHNKENSHDNWARSLSSINQNNSARPQSHVKKTPEVCKVPNSAQKLKTATPKIKSGIRKFTPGSTKHSHKKTPQKALIQNRDRVRVELFTWNPPKDELYCPPPRSEPRTELRPEPRPELRPELRPEPRPEIRTEPRPEIRTEPRPEIRTEPRPEIRTEPRPEIRTEPRPEIQTEPRLDFRPDPVPLQVPVPETPLNRKAMPASYVATPSYPQGVVNNNSKKLFKTTSIKDKKYMFIKKLGIGGSSEVYKVLEVGTSCEYAVKFVNLATDHEVAQGYINEVRLLRELQNSDRVIRLFDYEYDRSNQLLRLVLEVGETDLSSFLKARGAGLPPALVLHYWEEMLHAVNYIHEKGVIHADLKPANFLLVCGRLKLIDFGIASAISSDATSVVRSQAAGTYSYISPEALMGGAGGYGVGNGDGSAPIKISFRSDVWSLGCILYSMVYGRTPFGHIPNLAKLAVILDPNHRIDYPPVEHLPPSLLAALKWCLTYNARARPSVRELLSIPYLQAACTALPQQLLDKLQPHVTPTEYRLLQRAHTHCSRT